MNLGEKLQLLRSLEGNLRGLRRALSKSEVARLLTDERGATISQAYLSQLESGKREHLTAKTRGLLASFFKVHPGYLVSDPEDFQSDLGSAHLTEGRLDLWLESAAEDLKSKDAELSIALRELAAFGDTRRMVLLFARLARHPELLANLELHTQKPVPLAGHAEPAKAPAKPKAAATRPSA